jgi:hypothetical protein
MHANAAKSMSLVLSSPSPISVRTYRQAQAISRPKRLLVRRKRMPVYPNGQGAHDLIEELSDDVDFAAEWRLKVVL